MFITFPCYTSFGGEDSEEWELGTEVTDEEFTLMKKCYKKYNGERIYDISELEDLVSRIDEEAVKQATEDLLSYDRESVEGYIQEAIEQGYIEKEDDWTAGYVYAISIDWPYEIANDDE